MRKTLIGFFVAMLPAAALADFNGAPSLTDGQILSLDTGSVVTTGGDVMWKNNILSFQGTATGFSFFLSGNLGYDFLESAGSSFLSSNKSFFAGGSLTASASTVGSVIGVQTNGGNYAVLIVTANTGAAITLQFVTFGASAPSGPYVTQVMNNYSLIPAGLPNSGIAPGSLFIVQGSGLASATSVVALQSSGAGLPTTLNGASVSITDKLGTTASPAFYYAINSQLALVMPSNLSPGLAVLTVSYNGQTSAPYTIQIAKSAPGFAAYYGNGQGLGLATDPATGTVFGYSNPIPPGASVVLWGSGLGADPDRDTTFAPAAFAINNLATIYVGGVAATIQYQGASGYPGVNQINIMIPQNVPTGCFVPVTGVTTNGVPTNAIILPIANGACNEPALGWTSSLLAQLSSQQNVNTGFVEISSLTKPNSSGTGTQTVQSAVASFETLPGLSYGIHDGAVSIGGCILNKSLFIDPQAANATAPPGLNAGAISVAPPATELSKPVSLVRGTLTPGFYAATLPSGFVPSTGGTFTFTATGAQVGAFTAPITFLNPLQTWTNQNALGVVQRTGGLTVQWTGGDPGTITTVLATAYGTGSDAQVLCAADTAAGQLTVPAWILAAFPAAPGVIQLDNQTAFQSFTATGTDRAYTRGLVGTEIFTEFQ